MKYLIITFLFVIIWGIFSADAQSKKTKDFQRVNIPDSIGIRLKKVYEKEGESANAENNVFNLINPRDFVFKDGIFSFQGQGPHFPRRLFIFNKNKLFIFENDGAYSPVAVLKEFINCIDLLNLNSKQIVLYSCKISAYLADEYDATYGAEIK